MTKEQNEITDVIALLIFVREVFDEAPLQLAITLLLVARMEGKTTAEILKAGDVPKASFYRHLQKLSCSAETNTARRLVVTAGHEDGRMTTVYLTERGAEVVRQLCSTRNGAIRQALAHKH
ncbi:MAG: hypothetical protein K0S56_267 [Microvirga sp.]|jgi:DNA-binding MarR family transcriptional regulator|nr:hypothetical protein [Microvirga sp.]